MKRLLANGLRRAWRHLPRSSVLFRLCRMYVDFYNGDNNPDFELNGEAQTLRRLLPQCRVAFDVGANVGDWTALALHINPGLQIHCFEPSPETFQTLSTRRFPNQPRFNRFALGESPGQATLHLHATASNVNSLHAACSGAIAEATGTETVSVETLDDYCKRNTVDTIDYLKIDTEGHELAVLQGAREMLSRGAIRCIQLEYSPAYLDAGVLLRDVFSLLSERGYHAHKITPRGLVKIARHSSDLENFRLSNWLFTAPGPAL